MRHATLAALLIAAMPMISACGQRQEAHDPAAQVGTISGIARAETWKAVAQASAELDHGNLTLSDGDDTPKAEITPKGDLLIAGSAVAVDAAQRALLLQYRGQILAIASAGMDIGLQGADIGAKAAGEAIAGLFSGHDGDVEARIGKETEKLKASTKALCAKMPAMLATQRALAASLPAFKPYAKMDQHDVDDCYDEKD